MPSPVNRRIVAIVAELVLDHTHPSQFSALPPDPWEIARKAYVLGLAESLLECFEVWTYRGGRGAWLREDWSLRF